MYDNRPAPMYRDPKDNDNGQTVGYSQPPLTGMEYPLPIQPGGPYYPVPYQDMQQPQFSQQSQQVQPYQQPVSYLPQQHKNTESDSGGGGFKLPVNEIRSFVDRMGGMDGIMNTVSKMQKLVTSFQEMTPMLRTLLGSFGSKAATTGSPRQRSRKRSKAAPRNKSRIQHPRNRSGAKRRR